MRNRYEAPDEIRLQLLDSSDLMRDRGISLTHDLQGAPLWFVHEVDILGGYEELQEMARGFGYKRNRGYDNGQQWWVYSRCYEVAEMLDIAHVEALAA